METSINKIDKELPLMMQDSDQQTELFRPHVMWQGR